MKTKALSIFKSLADLPSETMAVMNSVSNSAAQMSQQILGVPMQPAKISTDTSRDLRRQQNERWQEWEGDSRYWRRGGLNE